MHFTAISNFQDFIGTYAGAFHGADTKVIELGAQDVNGSLRALCPPNFKYVGVDFVAGNGVDVVLKDPYSLPFESDSVDIVVTSSCLEHSEMFWLVFLEMLRILKPHGLLYINVPSNALFHRYPVDCWRFYPDSGRALVTWAKRNGVNAALLESFTSEQITDPWNDYVAIFVKSAVEAHRHAERILPGRPDLFNGMLLGTDEIFNGRIMPEDKRKLYLIEKILDPATPGSDEAKLRHIKMVVTTDSQAR